LLLPFLLLCAEVQQAFVASAEQLAEYLEDFEANTEGHPPGAESTSGAGATGMQHAQQIRVLSSLIDLDAAVGRHAAAHK
jgi:hypothetical protein